MRIFLISGCQDADPTTSVQFHDEHGNNQAWLSKEFDTRTNYSIKLAPSRISSNLKHVEMYWEAAREIQSLPEYRNNYVFIEYIIHLIKSFCDVSQFSVRYEYVLLARPAKARC